MTGRWRFLAIGLTLLFFLLLGLHQKASAEERYTVKQGDSLYGISKTFGVSVDVLKGANHLEGSNLKPKQVLLIPGRKEIQKADSAKRLLKTGVRRPLPEQESYVVSKGDNLYAISIKVGLSVEEIKKINHLHDTVLKIGQVVTLPKVGMEEELENEIEEPGDSEELTVAPDEKSEQEEASNKQLGKWYSFEERNVLVRVLKTFLGVPYRLGGSTLKGIDCSGFVKRIYQIFNVDLPRTAREQLLFGKKVAKNELEEGDLVFFHTRRPNGTHVGIYIGNNEFIHASSYKKEVKVDNLDMPYYDKRFLRGVRVKEFEKET